MCDRDPNTKPSGSESVLFRDSHGENISIKVLGCWDCVGSLGIPDLIPYFPFDDLINKKYEFFDTTINHKIEKAFHAVAIDEIREVFNVTEMKFNPKRNSDQVLQVWFPGEHGCVGGGTQATRGLSDAALDWMMKQVEELGLSLDQSCVEDGIKPSYNTPFDNSPQGWFKLTKTIEREITGDFSTLHSSVKERWNDSQLHYRPKNLQRFRNEL